MLESTWSPEGLRSRRTDSGETGSSTTLEPNEPYAKLHRPYHPPALERATQDSTAPIVIHRIGDSRHPFNPLPVMSSMGTEQNCCRHPRQIRRHCETVNSGWPENRNYLDGSQQLGQVPGFFAKEAAHAGSRSIHSSLVISEKKRWTTFDLASQRRNVVCCYGIIRYAQAQCGSHDVSSPKG